MTVDEPLLRDAAARAIRYLGGLDARGVAVTSEARANLDVFDQSLPAAGESPDAILALLDEVGSPATTATAGGRFFGFVVGGTLPVALAANWLASSWDQDAGMASICPINATLEEVSRRWLLDLFGLPTECGMGFVTGGTMANFSALAAARHAVLTKSGWDVEANGLFGAPPLTVVVSDEVHVSLIKALGLLGFGRQRVVRIPTDRQGRMRTNGLPDLNGPAIVCLQAGNVNTGAFDPASDLCAWAHERGVWVHVDGAFGLWAAASPRRSHLMTGFADADSWAVDAHKWLNVPYDSGIVCVRDPETLRGAMMTSAPYLEQGAPREPDQFTPEMSRRARGVDIWAALRALGRTGVVDLIERCCQHASRFAEGLADAGYEILNDVVLNQVLVSFGPPEVTRQVIADLQASGVCWCGGTVWQGRTAMRISVSSWATTGADVERCLTEMIAIAAHVCAEQRTN